jgi:hypothetical protein
MDSGRFESVSRPYSFHQVMRGLFIPLRLATDARHLELVTDLDPCIDKVGSSSFPWTGCFSLSSVVSDRTIQVAHDAVCLARGLDPETAFDQDAPAFMVLWLVMKLG